MKHIHLIICCLLLAAPLYAQHPARPEIVAEQKAILQQQGVDLSGACGAFAITKAVAWRLQSEGVGLLDKPGGNQCQGYSVDFVTYTDGAGVDILGDAGGANVPGWDPSEPPGALLGRWRPPISPTTQPPPPPVGSGGTVQPPPGTGATVYDLDVIQRLMRIENQGLQSAARDQQLLTLAVETNVVVKETGTTIKDVFTFVGKYIAPSLTAILATWQVTKE